MSINRFLVPVTIAIAALGTSCLPGGVLTEKATESPAAVVEQVETPAAEAAPAAEAPIQPSETSTETSSTESADEASDLGTAEITDPIGVFDEDYIADLENRIANATELDEAMQLMSEWITYLETVFDDDAGIDGTATTTWTVDEGAVDDLAEEYGATVEEVEALIAADPVLAAFFERAEVVPVDDAAVDTTEATADTADTSDTTDAGEAAEHWSQDWSEEPTLGEEWIDDPVFVFPEYQDIVVPWGLDGDPSCGDHLAHLESDWYYAGSGGATSNGYLTDAHSTITSVFASSLLAEEAYWGMFQCEAEVLNDRMMWALGMDGGQELIHSFDDFGDDFHLTAFEAPDAGIVVIFMQEYDQVTIHVQYGLGLWDAIDEMWYQLGY